ncbi:MAG: hypothetical protein J6Y37_03670 [Paludibacteraceae bacterium]|nr:hypothetical protein [Paludibacteraceae bacterium]
MSSFLFLMYIVSHPASSITQHNDQIKSDNLSGGSDMSAITYPAMQTMPCTMLMLLSYVSLSPDGHSVALNAMMHFPTNIDTMFEYTNDAMAKTHTFHSMKQRYSPSRQPHVDSVTAN